MKVLIRIIDQCRRPMNFKNNCIVFFISMMLLVFSSCHKEHKREIEDKAENETVEIQNLDPDVNLEELQSDFMN